MKNFFMDRCPKDEPTGKNLVWNKTSSHSQEKPEKPFFGVASTPLAIGLLKCIIIKNNEFCDRLNGLARRLCTGFNSICIDSLDCRDFFPVW